MVFRKFPLLLATLLAIFPLLLPAQVPWDKLELADSLYRVNDFSRALENYKPALKYYWEKKTFHKAARCAAGVKDYNLAMGYLERAIDLGWPNSRVLRSDKILAPLAGNPRFERLIQRLETIEGHIKEIKTPGLLAELDSIYADDQRYRVGRPNEAAQARLDSSNLLRVERLIGQYGWPGSNLLDGRNYCWLVVQRQPLDVQKKYYGLIAKAVRNGEEDPGFLAILEDKMLIEQGKKQKYGTQTDAVNRKIYPLKNPKKVDIYRAKVGMNSIEVLKKRFTID